MVLNHVPGLMLQPTQEWHRIHDERMDKDAIFLRQTPLLALIPSLCFYFGVTQIGWQLGWSENLMFFTPVAALALALLSYVASLLGVWVFGEAVEWMKQTYTDTPEATDHGMALAVHATTPLFLAGAALVWPNIWFNALMMIAAGCYSAYLIFIGLPILMRISPERAFMYACSVVTIALVMLVSLRVFTVVVWASNFGPNF